MAKTLADFLAEAGVSPSLPPNDFATGYNNNYLSPGVSNSTDTMSLPSGYVGDPTQARYVGEGATYYPTIGGVSRPAVAAPSQGLLASIMVNGKNQARAPGAGGNFSMSQPDLQAWWSSTQPNYVGKEVPLPNSGLAAIDGQFAADDPLLAANGYSVGANGKLQALPKPAANLPSTVPFPWPSGLGAGGATSAQQPLQYQIDGGYVWAKSNDGRWVSLGRAPNNPPANPVNMIGQGIAGIGNQMGINLGTMNGLDMAHFLDQQGLAPVAPQRRYNADTNQWEYVNGAPKSAPTGVAGSPKAPMSPFGNLGGGLLGQLLGSIRAPAIAPQGMQMIPGVGVVPKANPNALSPQAAQHYAQTGTYADNDPSNNAANFARNAKDGFSDFLSGGL